MTNLTGKMVSNFSVDVQNSTDLKIVYKINLPSHIVNGIVSILTILFNIALIVCIRTHRRNISEVVRHQLISLGISDLIAGVAPGLWCFTMFQAVNTSVPLCGAIHLTFNISQYATVLNLCHLSVRRWIVLIKCTQLTSRPRLRLPLALLFTSLAWLISLLCHLPAIAGLTTKRTVNGCYSPEMFQNPDAFIYLVPLYIITLLSLDVFFIHSLIIIRKLNLRVSTVREKNESRTQFKANSNVLAEEHAAHVLTPEVMQNRNFDVHNMSQNRNISMHEIVQPQTSQVLNAEPSTAANVKDMHQPKKAVLQIIPNTENSFFPEVRIKQTIQNKKGNKNNESQVSQGTGKTKSSEKKIHSFRFNQHNLQQKAFKHLLAALLITNLTTLPYIAISCSYVFGALQLEPENVLVLDMQILSLNSLINPLIYGIIIKEVRSALIENVTKITHCQH